MAERRWRRLDIGGNRNQDRPSSAEDHECALRNRLTSRLRTRETLRQASASEICARSPTAQSSLLQSSARDSHRFQGSARFRSHARRSRASPGWSAVNRTLNVSRAVGAFLCVTAVSVRYISVNCGIEFSWVLSMPFCDFPDKDRFVAVIVRKESMPCLYPGDYQLGNAWLLPERPNDARRTTWRGFFKASDNEATVGESFLIS
jgi:hypothetical protein